METTEGLRIVDLADEFGISISETLSLCAVYGVEAPYGSSTVSPSAANLLRGLANGTIDPDNPDPALLAEAGGAMAKPAAQPATYSGPVASDASDVATSNDGSAEQVDDAWGEVPELEDDGVDYDAYGVAGLGDLNPVRTPKAVTAEVATPTPTSGPPVANRHTPPVLPKASSTSGLGDSREARKAAEVAKYERRSGGRRRKDEADEPERKEYDPTKLKAQYDDIDQYVPKWLKYATLAAVVLFAGLAYTLLFSGDSTDQQAGVITTPEFDVGECFTSDPGLWIDTINPVPCQAPHNGEIFATYTFPAPLAAAYPDAASLESETRQSCGAKFTAYTGDSLVASPFRVGVSFPSQVEWNSGKRVAYCSVVDNAGAQLEGSAAR